MTVEEEEDGGEANEAPLEEKQQRQQQLEDDEAHVPLAEEGEVEKEASHHPKQVISFLPSLRGRDGRPLPLFHLKQEQEEQKLQLCGVAMSQKAQQQQQ
jgi:hypothetical protein